MGDGKVALILDVLGLAQCTAVSGESRSQTAGDSEHLIADQSGQKQALLLFRAGEFERLAVPLSLVARLEEIPQAKLERAAGRTVVQYREQILPLVPLAEYLGSSAPVDAFSNDTAQVIVFSDAERRIGLVVDQIIDIVDETVTMKRPSDRSGLLGSAVVGQRITDFLDLQSIIQQAEEGWFDQAGSQRKQATVLVAEASAFSRSLLRNTLEIAGYHVIEASSESEAIDKLGRHEVNVLVAALDLPNGSASTLLQSVKNNPNLRTLPVLALSGESEVHGRAPATDASFDDYLTKFDRASMLRSIEKLAFALESAEQGVEALVD